MSTMIFVIIQVFVIEMLLLICLIPGFITIAIIIAHLITFLLIVLIHDNYNNNIIMYSI